MAPILAAGTSDGKVMLWDITSGLALPSPDGEGYPVYSLVFSPDGKKVGAIFSEDTVKIWEVSSGSELLAVKQAVSSPQTIAFSPDGKLLAIGHQDGTLDLWNIGTNKIVQSFPKRAGAIESIAFSPDGDLCASGTQDELELRSLKTGFRSASFPNEIYGFDWIVFSPDGAQIATGSDNSNTIEMIEIHKGTNVFLSGNGLGIKSVAFLNDTGLLVSGSLYSQFEIWNIKEDRVVKTLSFDTTGSQLEAAVSPTFPMVAVITGQDTITLYDFDARREHAAIVHAGTAMSVSFSPRDKVLALGYDDNSIQLWDLQRNQEICSLLGHTNPVISLAFSPDGRYLASRSGDVFLSEVLLSMSDVPMYETRIWDAVTGDNLGVLPAQVEAMKALVFSPDSNRLAVGTDGGAILLWDVARRKTDRTLQTGKNDLTCLVWSPDGTRIVAGFESGEICLFDAGTGSSLTTMTVAEGGVTTLAFVDGGRTIVSCSDAGRVQYWNPVSSQSVKMLYIDPGYITSTPGLPLVVTLGTGNSANGQEVLKLWNSGSGKLLRAMSLLETYPAAISLSPGMDLLCASSCFTYPVLLSTGLDLDRKEIIKRLKELVDYGLSYTLDNNGAHLFKDPITFNQSRYLAAKDGLITILPDGGRGYAERWKNALEQTNQSEETK